MTLSLKRTAILALGVVLLFLMSACGPNTGTVAGSPSQSGSTSTPTVSQVLQNSTNAMKKLTSFHFNFNMGSTTSITSNASGTTKSQQTVLTMQGTGDQAAPDQVSTQLSMTIVNQTLKMAEILLGNKAYIQNFKAKWYVIDKSALTGSSASNPFSGTSVQQYNKLLALATKGASFVDHGVQTLGTEKLRHITVTFSNDVLKDLLNTTGQLNNQQNIDQLLKSVKINKPTLDLWEDDATSYPHRLEFKMNLTLGMNAKATPTTDATAAATSVNSAIDMVIDYSKFNQPVTITAPTDATPASSLIGIFS